MADTFKPTLLHAQLIAVIGDVIHGTDTTGHIWWKDGHPVDNEEADAETVKANYDPVDHIKERRSAAQAEFAANAPTWAGWSPDEMEQYIIDNVTDLASAKLALRIMAFAIGALADRAFPNRR